MANVVVSVVMPVYNAENSLAEAIHSVLRQEYVEFELIIVDDGSRDASLFIANQFTDPRTRIVSQPNAGYASAMNYGIKLARGHYIARMDSDDKCKPDRLLKQVEFLDRFRDFVLVGTKHGILSPNGCKVPLKLTSLSSSWTEETWQMIVDGTRTFCDPSVVFRTEAARRLGGYRNYQRSGMDVDMWLRLLENGGKAAVLNEVLYYLRMGHDTITSNPMVTAKNKIPRLLALDRIKSGTDAVMRGESVDSLITSEMISNAWEDHIRQLWFKAEICFRVREWKNGWRFALLGCYKGGLSIRNLHRLASVIRRAFLPPAVPSNCQPEI